MYSHWHFHADMAGKGECKNERKKNPAVASINESNVFQLTGGAVLNFESVRLTKYTKNNTIIVIYIIKTDFMKNPFEPK